MNSFESFFSQIHGAQIVFFLAIAGAFVNFLVSSKSTQWRLTNGKKILCTPLGAKIVLPRNAIDIQSFGTAAVVLLNYKGVTPEEASRNVIAYDQTGARIWHIEPVTMTQGKTPYTVVGIVDDSVFLFNAIGFDLYLDPTSGKILRIEETR